MKLAVAVLLVATSSAYASTVKELGPDALYDGAERVVDAEVIASVASWNAAHTGIETHVTLAVSATYKGPSAATIEMIVPGGELAGGRQVIVGMPSANVGERARWFLRDRGDGALAVYGWAQGKWPERIVDGAVRYVRDPVGAERDGRFIEFALNGMKWPAAKIPVQYLVQSTGTPDMSLSAEIAAIDAAFKTWQDVPCSSLSFVNAGMTNLGEAIDGNNVMLFIESNWIYGTEAAAATSLWIIDGQQTADIAMNGEKFTWANGPPGNGINSNVLDLQAVLTHEIGHFSGLGHTMRAFDTMYYSWKPWPGQRAISIDDKLGLCALYSMHGDECPSPACPNGEQCVTHHDGRLCTGEPDPIGATCNYDRVECADFCLFTMADLSEGYCSRFCEANKECPSTHHCGAASAGTMPVKVCLVGPQPAPDAGVAACSNDDACPVGQYCDLTTHACTFQCRTSADCSGGRECGARGLCEIGDGGGCGCRSSSGAPFALCAFALLLRRRRRR